MNTRMEPGSPEWEARRRQLLNAESAMPLRIWWLSFVGEERGEFLGVAIVRAPGMVSAVQRTHRLGINPGGEVLAFELPDNAPVNGCMDRLLSKPELLERGLGGSVQ